MQLIFEFTWFLFVRKNNEGRVRLRVSNSMQVYICFFLCVLGRMTFKIINKKIYGTQSILVLGAATSKALSSYTLISHMCA